MSRRRSSSTATANASNASNANNANMGPPPDRDVVMGPPPVPPMSSQAASQQKPKDPQEITEKYRKLKRRYFELEEKHKETASELQRSGERNVKMREERNLLLDRIIELESPSSPPKIVPNGTPSNSSSHSPTNTPPVSDLQPPSSAFPRSLLSARARTSFIGNLRQAMAEDTSTVPNSTAQEEEEEEDPLMTSRHVGPLAKKRAEEERREKIEEEARETRRAARRGRNVPANANATSSAGSGKGKDTSTHSPAPTSSPQPQVLVSSTGTRLKIKPPAPPPQQQQQQAEQGPSQHQAPPAPTPSSSSHPQQPPQHHPRSESPVSPMAVSPRDEQQPAGPGYSPAAAFRVTNGNGNGNGNAPAPHHSPSMTLRSASATHPAPAPAPTAVAAPASGPQAQPRPSPSQSHRSPSTSHAQQPQQQPQQQGRPSDNQRHAKPKRLKAHTVTSKSFSIPMVPRDKRGRPMLPLNVGIMTVINLGDVCMREHFHTERYIFPVGYEVTRRYLSTVDPNAEVVYHCTILDGGDGPKFQIIPSDVPDRPVIAGTATGAWSNIVKQANQIRNRQHSNSVSGPDFFGLGQNTIKHLIQELPAADRLRDYVWQNFVEGGPLGGRHAAVIPALPEEYDSAMPIGPYYPQPHEREAKREAAEHVLPPAPSTPSSSRDAQQQQQQQQQQPQQQQQQPQPQPQPQQQPVQPGVTTIVLPPPTTSETLNIQEYQPPPPREVEPRNSNHSSNSRSRLDSHSPPTSNTRGEPYTPPTHQHQTRSSSARSPYLANASPPPVPPTFASIMNAYPAPAASPPTASGSGAAMNE